MTVAATPAADPLNQPLIDAGYLSEPADMPQFVAGIRLAQEILAAKQLGDLLGRELGPGADAQATEVSAYVLDRASGTIYHPVGTCRMGSDALAVVDPNP